MILERRRRDAHERPLLAENRAVEGLQLRPGLDPELLDERPARVVIRRERLGLTATAVEREHQVRPQLLTQRVGTDEHFDLGDELCVRAQVQISGDPLLEHAEAQIFEPMDLRLRERLQLEGRERGNPAPVPAFEVDADLRPEGRQGALVRSLSAFREYYERWVSVWEVQALLRAVPVAGDMSSARTSSP